MHHHPGRIEHRPQRRCRPRFDARQHRDLDLLGREVAVPGPVLHVANQVADHVLTQPRPRLHHPGQRQQPIGARDPPAWVGAASRPLLEGLAEADGNRTRQTEILDLTGFEDRGDHQEPKRLRRPI